MAITFEEGETILFEVRKHWFVIAAEISFAFIAVMAPLVGYAIFSVLPITIEAPGNTLVLFLFFYALWLLFVWITIFTLWTNYYLDVWIVTDKRLIDVEQIGLFRREIASLNLARIQDVKSETHGIIATMMKFGDLHLQTAASEKEFVITNVAEPHKMRDAIHSLI